MQHRRLVPISAGLALALVAAPVHADGRRREVSVDVSSAPDLASCVTYAELREAVAERLGYDAFVRDATTSAHIHVERSGRRLIGTIQLRDEASNGTRSIESNADCAELRQSIAVALALGIDPLGEGAASNAPPAPPLHHEAHPSVEATQAPSEPRDKPIDAAESSWRPRIGVGLGVDVGTMPSVAPEATIHAGLHHRAWSIGLSVRGLLPATQANDTRDYSIGGGDITVDGLRAIGPLWLGPVARVGLLDGSASGPGPRSHDTAWFSMVGARAALEVAIGSSLVVRPQIDLTMAPLRSVVQMGASDAWTMPLAQASFSVLAIGGP